MVLSAELVETPMNHWLLVVSYWIGCPISPEFLSDTLLTTLKTPPLLLILSGVSVFASFKVLATLIFLLVVNPAVIA